MIIRLYAAWLSLCSEGLAPDFKEDNESPHSYSISEELDSLLSTYLVPGLIP